MTDEISAAIQTDLDFLMARTRDMPDRQRSLRAVYDYTWRLLTDPERQALARLSVFRGSFDRAAAQAVSEVAATTLVALMDKSLLRRADVGRYSLHELLRHFTAERLVAQGETTALRNRHLAHYLALAEQAAPELKGPHLVVWLERLEGEIDNLRAALSWALEQGALEGLRLAGELGRFWRLHGYLREGLGWLEALLALPADVPESASRTARAQALASAGELTWRLGDYARATALLAEALDLWREVGDTDGMATSLNSLGNVAYRQGNYDAATGLYREALSLRRQVGDMQGESVALGNLGRVALQRGDAAQAFTLLEETLALKRRVEDTQGIAGTLTSLGRVAIRQGDYARAISLLEESLALKDTMGDKHGRVTALSLLGWVTFLHGDIARATPLLQESLRLGWEIGARDRMAEVLESLAAVSAATGRPRQAAQLGGAAEALRTELGLPLSLDQQRSHDQMVQAARVALGEDGFAAAWAAWQAGPLEEATTYALEESEL